MRSSPESGGGRLLNSLTEEGGSDPGSGRSESGTSFRWSAPRPIWELERPPDPSAVEALQRHLQLPRVLCAVLATRGKVEAPEAKDFLRPRLSHLHSPETLPGLDPAVNRIGAALERGERILVHGDYDVDGMAGAALLTHWLRRMGGEVIPFVPHRVRDGYDLGSAGLQRAVSQGCTLLVTVDCGVRAHGAVAEAAEMGIDVIVTDHHAPGETLPPAVAVLDPARSDSSYPFPALAGTGVAFKLCEALAYKAGMGSQGLEPFLDLVGLATIADLVPLTGENRVLARFGLRALSQTTNPGLRALYKVAGIAPDIISPGQVAFGIAPRLNALGRMGEAMDGLRLLLVSDPAEAARLALEAEAINQERKEEDQRTLAQAMERLDREFRPDQDYGVVLESDDWHPGVIGIVASRIVERIHRPVILLAMEGDTGRGSGRSIPEYPLLKGIQACDRYLERYGGHRMAAGMEIRRDRLEGFKAAFNAEVRQTLEGEELRPRLPVDVEVELNEMTDELHHFLRYLGPHGIGNPGPRFLVRGVDLARSPKIVGSDHLKLRLRQGSSQLDAIGFGLGRDFPPGRLGSGPLDVVFQLRENEFRGRRNLQAHIRDLRPTGTLPSAGRGWG